MIQEVIVLLIFVVAVAYLVHMVYQNFKPNSAGCTKGCSSCSALDIKKIEEQIRKAKVSNGHL